MVFLYYLLNRCIDDAGAYSDVLLQKGGDLYVPGFTGAAFLYA